MCGDHGGRLCARGMCHAYVHMYVYVWRSWGPSMRSRYVSCVCTYVCVCVAIMGAVYALEVCVMRMYICMCMCGDHGGRLCARGMCHVYVHMYVYVWPSWGPSMRSRYVSCVYTYVCVCVAIMGAVYALEVCVMCMYICMCMCGDHGGRLCARGMCHVYIHMYVYVWRSWGPS